VVEVVEEEPVAKAVAEEVAEAVETIVFVNSFNLRK
jgi:hypothetical protein